MCKALGYEQYQDEWNMGSLLKNASFKKNGIDRDSVYGLKHRIAISHGIRPLID